MNDINSTKSKVDESKVYESKVNNESKKLDFKTIVLDFLKAYPGLNALNMIIALTLTPINEVLLPAIYGRLIGNIEKGQPFKKSLIFLISILVTVQLGYYVEEYLDMLTQPKLFDFVKTRMVSAILEKYDGDIVEIKSGQVVSKIVRLPEIIARWMNVLLEWIVPLVFTTIVAMSYFMFLDVQLAVYMSIMIGFVLYTILSAPKKCLKLSIKREQCLDDVHDDVEDVMRNLTSIYSMDTSDQEINRLHASGKHFYNANKAALSCLLKYKLYSIPVVIVFVTIVVLRCTSLIERKKMNTGTFVTIFMIAMSLLNNLMWVVAVIKDASAEAGTIVEAQEVFSKSLHSKAYNDIDTHVISNSIVKYDTGIGFYDVTFAHTGMVVPVIDAVTVHFEANERTAIVGPIGTGKSTVLKLLMAFLTPTDGKLYIDGTWYSDMAPKDVRRLVAYMPQDAILFDRSILENILYGTPDKTEEDVSLLIASLGIEHEFENMSQGLATQVGKNGSRLSGGQRQLVWFMRIALRDPHYIILDEPTASMDADTKSSLMDALYKFSVGRTVIMVTHDDELLQFATRVLHW